GIGANTAIFSVVNTLFLHPPGVVQPGQVVVLRVRLAKTGVTNSRVSAPDFARIRDSKTIFSSAALGHTTPVSFNTGNHSWLAAAARVSSQWFNVFGAKPILGRVFSPDEDQPNADHEAVLSYWIWQHWFGGDASVIGRTTELSDQRYRIVGVMGRDFIWPDSPDFWLPLALPQSAFDAKNSFDDQYVSVARLQPHVTFAQAASYVDVLSRQFADPSLKARAESSRWSMFLMTFPDFTFGDLHAPLMILSAAVAFVLLIACANIAGLLLARAAGRSKELAVRTALGASRPRLIAQAFAENFILGVLGVSAGLILAAWAVQALVLAGPQNLPRNITFSLDGYVLGFSALVGIFAVLISGVVPAWRMSRANPQNALHETSVSVTGSRARQNFRSWLVIAELALGLVLLAGTSTLLRSLARIENTNPGFNPRGVATVGMVLPKARYDSPDKQYAFFHDALRRLGTMEGITAFGFADPMPFLSANPSANFEIEGRPVPAGDPGPNANIRIVDGGFFTTFEIPLRQGRFFTDDDRVGSQPVVIIDENLARQYWPSEDPIGKKIRRGPTAPWMTIVGVVGHIRFSQLVGEESSASAGINQHGSVQSASKGAFYVSVFQDRAAFGFLVARSNQGAAAADLAIRQTLQAQDSSVPSFSYSMDELIAQSLAPQRFATTLTAVFAALAVLLAAIGLYGLISYNVAQRINEFGVRVALGASSADISRLVLSQGVKLALIGAGGGILAGLILMRALRSALYGVSAADPVSFLAAALLLVIIALAACYIPARRATKVDPMVALRYE
ncbi:MAG TPA: ABC transporter permease, partial [Candidatus Acidoferrales bacterium]|nr:ABC transporter permease [Candidatus Acidoferrales bacterium]